MGEEERREEELIKDSKIMEISKVLLDDPEHLDFLKKIGRVSHSKLDKKT